VVESFSRVVGHFLRTILGGCAWKNFFYAWCFVFCARIFPTTRGRGVSAHGFSRARVVGRFLRRIFSKHAWLKNSVRRNSCTTRSGKMFTREKEHGARGGRKIARGFSVATRGAARGTSCEKVLTTWKSSGALGGIDSFGLAQADNSGVNPPNSFVTVDFSPGAVPFPPYITAVWVIRVK
jgi:hypothetical protein